MSRRVVVKVIRDGTSILDEALDYAIARGMNRCDKHTTAPLTSTQRLLLEQEIGISFWLYLSDNGVKVQ